MYLSTKSNKRNNKKKTVRPKQWVSSLQYN